MIAIIMASGLGTRMRPLTLDIPKPLIPVCHKPMIETVIEGLIEGEVERIYVVVGYLGEQFLYLKEKYPNIYIIKNPDYENVNNISSIYAAKDVMIEDCFICEADLYVRDKSIFSNTLNYSYYCGKMVSGYSNDWVFEQDVNGYITRVGKGGNDCYNMVGVAFFKEKESKILIKKIEEVYGKPGYNNLFWDDVVNDNLNELKLKIRPVFQDQIVEIDTIEELEKVEKSLFTLK